MKTLWGGVTYSEPLTPHYRVRRQMTICLILTRLLVSQMHYTGRKEELHHKCGGHLGRRWLLEAMYNTAHSPARCSESELVLEVSTGACVTGHSACYHAFLTLIRPPGREQVRVHTHKGYSFAD